MNITSIQSAAAATAFCMKYYNKPDRIFVCPPFTKGPRINEESREYTLLRQAPREKAGITYWGLLEYRLGLLRVNEGHVEYDSVQGGGVPLLSQTGVLFFRPIVRDLSDEEFLASYERGKQRIPDFDN
ncbi:MAG: hypothetical protein NVS1B7_1830 [Candidatus Saccharimonadales bacterium]